MLQHPDSPLRIILLTDPLRHRPLTGIGRYVLELARGMAGHPGVGELLFFERREWKADPFSRFDPSVGSVAPARQRVDLRQILPFPVLQDRLSTWLRRTMFTRSVRRMSRPARDFILHGPNFQLYPFDGPSLVTFHDLSIIHYPDFHPPRRVKFMEREIPKSLGQADRILTVSNYVRQEINEVLGVPLDKIDVVYNGVDQSFQTMESEQTTQTLAAYGLVHGRYLLSVATPEPRKNLIRLVRAYARLPGQMQARCPLVLAGGGGWLSDDLEANLAPLEHQGHVRRPGYIPQEHLPTLFAGAAGFALPSLYEGFGLPVLEAMACGVPVLTSNRASLPEVAGDAALLVNPEDEDELLAGLTRLLEDDHFQTTARSQGPTQAAGFTWSRCVEQTLLAYDRAR